MKEQNLSLAQLANLSGVPKPTLHGWTTGRRAMNPDQLKMVAAALKVSVYRLLFGETDPFENSTDDLLRELFSGDVRVTIHRIERQKRGS